MLKKRIKDGLIIAGLSLFLLMSSQIVKAEQDLRLLCYWAFDEGEGELIKDSSHCENIGTMVECTWKKGIKGSCLELNGWKKGGSIGWESYGKNSYIRAGCDAPEDEFTVEGWFNTYGGEGTQWIIEASDGRQRVGFDIYIRPGGRALQVALHSKKRKHLTTSISLNTWHHFAFTFKSLEYMRLYLDGKLVGENKSVEKYLRSRIHGIGFWRANPSYYHGFCGMLDELKMYDEVLSSEEILKHYQEVKS